MFQCILHNFQCSIGLDVNLLQIQILICYYRYKCMLQSQSHSTRLEYFSFYVIKYSPYGKMFKLIRDVDFNEISILHCINFMNDE
jgi:hypothetical protein